MIRLFWRRRCRHEFLERLNLRGAKGVECARCGLRTVLGTSSDSHMADHLAARWAAGEIGHVRMETGAEPGVVSYFYTDLATGERQHRPPRGAKPRLVKG